MNADRFLPDAETVAAIERDVAIYNQRRERAHAEVERRVPVMLAAYVFAFALVVFLAWRFLPNPGIAVVLAMLSISVGSWFWKDVAAHARRPATWTQQQFRDHILPVMFGFVGDLRYQHGTRPRSFDRLPRETVPHNRALFDDVIRGEIGGRRFEIFEVTMGEQVKDSLRVTFKGVVLACRLQRPFPGTLIAYRKLGNVQRFFRDLLSRGKLREFASGDETLDRLYDVLTDRRGEAGRLLSGGLAEVLVWVERTWHGDTARLAVTGEDLFLMLPSKRDFFELPPIDRPLDYRLHLEPMVRHFASLLAIAERVYGIDGDAPPAAS